MSNTLRKSPSYQSLSPDLIPTLVIAAGNLQSEISRQLGAMSAKKGLTFSKLRILHSIAMSEGQLTCADIGRFIGSSRQSALKQLNLLSDQGFILRDDNPANERAPLFRLSPNGKMVFNEMAAIWSTRSDGLSTELAKDQIGTEELLACIQVIKATTKALRAKHLA